LDGNFKFLLGNDFYADAKALQPAVKYPQFQPMRAWIIVIRALNDLYMNDS
jgi:hypothetical protein